MQYGWNIGVTWMDNWRNMDGILVECKWNMDGMWMDYVWHEDGLWMEYACNTAGTWKA